MKASLQKYTCINMYYDTSAISYASGTHLTMAKTRKYYNYLENLDLWKFMDVDSKYAIGFTC